MAYSGTYKVKNPTKYRGNAQNIVYRSLWERSAFKWCDTTTRVLKWSSEEVVVPYFYDVDKRMHRYFVDLLIEFKEGTILVEIKPKKETTVPKKQGKKTKAYLNESMTYVKNQNKWKAATTYAHDRGWTFEIWTEDTLKKMGIMKKGLKPLKPLKKPINRKKARKKK